MVEKVKYDVLRTIGDIEIRKYPPMILAEVQGITGDSGFSYLFNYISGENKSKKKIEMTTPVIRSEKIKMTAPVLSKKDYMAFIMPSKYTKDTIPEPTNPSVKLRFQDEKTYAVLKFSGIARVRSVKEHFEQLFLTLNENDIESLDETFLMRYNSPFAPGFIRRNEVAVEVRI
jgi:hypothetical protein